MMFYNVFFKVAVLQQSDVLITGAPEGSLEFLQDTGGPN